MTISHVGTETVDQAGALSLTPNLNGIAFNAGDFAICFVKQSENTSARIWDDDGGGGNGWTQEAYNRFTSGRQHTLLGA